MTYRLPAEWEKHRATWISWPKNIEDWPEKFEPIPALYAEIVRVLALGEFVEIFCHDETVKAQAQHLLQANHVPKENYRLHILETDRSWLRDSAPTFVKSSEDAKWIEWHFNGWAKYDDYKLDAHVPTIVSNLSKIPLNRAYQQDNKSRFVLEGGAIESNGAGTLLVTEECLLSEIQCRNPVMKKVDYEAAFQKYLGIEKTIWLGRGCVGDDTHGHIDDIARFTTSDTVLLAIEKNRADENFETSHDNLERLKSSSNQSGKKLKVIEVPFPEPIYFNEQRLPASYLNFYISNAAVLVPVFHDKNDLPALKIISEQFPDRPTIGIYARDLVLGLGTLHCLTQPEFE
jgi:agmatine deiminase